jgi:hypothetical protein
MRRSGGIIADRLCIRVSNSEQSMKEKRLSVIGGMRRVFAHPLKTVPLHGALRKAG